ncbi:MAG: threonylcarbamoyl-AMP synthase [Firmicutes bacterium]|nr:threonylcarbamoyl-AMP synthase [Bacillota bacterium]
MIETLLLSTEEEDLRKGAGIIKDGGLVAFPTETVYGLGADAFDPGAARRAYAAKGRPSDNPLIVHISKTEDLYKAASEVPGEALKLAEAFWPGPLTMIFKKNAIVPDETTGGLDTVAVRFPADEAAAYFIEQAGGFVAAPSANVSGRPSPTKASHVAEDMLGRIDAIIAGGSSDIGVESTIVDLTRDIPEILRPGFVTYEMLTNVLGRVNIDKTILSDSSKTAPRAPGMKYRHYAPKAPMTIVEGSPSDVADYINRMRETEYEGELTAVLTTGENRNAYRGEPVYVMTEGHDLSSVAKRLYAVLRECDANGVTRIYSESFSEEGMGLAVMNRLMKAAGHSVVKV